MDARRRLKRFTAYLLFTALAADGCQSRLAEGQVKGRVMYQGQPLPSGTVTLLAADGSTVSAGISSEGEYRFAKIPVGLVRIGVVSHPRVPKGLQQPAHHNPPAPAAQLEKPISIPAHYNKPETSGLICDVRNGENTHDIELMPVQPGKR
jgi:hypothetical protein